MTAREITNLDLLATYATISAQSRPDLADKILNVVAQARAEVASGHTLDIVIENSFNTIEDLHVLNPPS